MAMLAPDFSAATEDDADEAEEQVARMRAERSDEARKRDQHLFDLAIAGDRREKEILTLTRVSVVASAISLIVAVAALVAAITTGG
jgi:hypothetical protein